MSPTKSWMEISSMFGHKQAVRKSADSVVGMRRSVRVDAVSTASGGLSFASTMDDITSPVSPRDMPDQQMRRSVPKASKPSLPVYDSPLRNNGKEIHMGSTVFQKTDWSNKTRGSKGIVFKCEHGEVYFTYEQLPSNCGIALLYGPCWSVKSMERMNTEEYKEVQTKLWKATHEFIITHSDRNKIMVSDRVGGLQWYGFCKTNGWREGEHTYNGNSDNKVVIFETDRDQLIGKDLKIAFGD